ncbi:hypothetical protein [Geofilum rhodophaeum]|uniref:hypothetical protein n=1 Tax=Geofilum rhodophaeum TaxID=1965019 RepID=UPI000B521AFF|nr:hypothetical protein [Geofilum rhodophaeum]
MLNVYQNEVFETRKAFRRVVHHDRLLQECNKNLKKELAQVRKAATSLRRASIDTEALHPGRLWTLMYEDLGKLALKRRLNRQKVLFVQLNWMAGNAVLEESTRYMERIKGGSRYRRRSIQNREEKVKKLMEQETVALGEQAQIRLMHFTSKMGDCKGQLLTLAEAIALGVEAKSKLHELSLALKGLRFWGNGDQELPEPHDVEANMAFEHIFQLVVPTHILLCGFRNEAFDFINTRDFELHMEALKDFKDSFFNALLSDWVEQRKVRMCSFGVQKNIEALDLLLQGLRTKKKRTEEELEILHEESRAIMAAC